MAGIPGTLAALAVHPALVVLIALATIVVWRHGNELDEYARSNDLEQELQRDRERKASELAAEWDVWDRAWEAADADLASGRITKAEHGVRIDALLDLTPGE